MAFMPQSVQNEVVPLLLFYLATAHLPEIQWHLKHRAEQWCIMNTVCLGQCVVKRCNITLPVIIQAERLRVHARLQSWSQGRLMQMGRHTKLHTRTSSDGALNNATCRAVTPDKTTGNDVNPGDQYVVQVLLLSASTTTNKCKTDIFIQHASLYGRIFIRF